MLLPISIRPVTPSGMGSLFSQPWWLAVIISLFFNSIFIQSFINLSIIFLGPVPSSPDNHPLPPSAFPLCAQVPPVSPQNTEIHTIMEPEIPCHPRMKYHPIFPKILNQTFSNRRVSPLTSLSHHRFRPPIPVYLPHRDRGATSSHWEHHRPQRRSPQPLVKAISETFLLVLAVKFEENSAVAYLYDINSEIFFPGMPVSSPHSIPVSPCLSGTFSTAHSWNFQAPAQRWVILSGPDTISSRRCAANGRVSTAQP